MATSSHNVIEFHNQPSADRIAHDESQLLQTGQRAHPTIRQAMLIGLVDSALNNKCEKFSADSISV